MHQKRTRTEPAEARTEPELNECTHSYNLIGIKAVVRSERGLQGSKRAPDKGRHGSGWSLVGSERATHGSMVSREQARPQLAFKRAPEFTSEGFLT